MPRTHLLLLAIGVLFVVLAGLGGETSTPGPDRVVDAAENRSDDLGEPDLYVETAEISRFRPDGRLAYRILAGQVVHYPEADHTQLRAPRMTLFREGEPPWEASAELGRVIGGTGLLDAGAPPGTGDEAAREEIVELEDEVIIRRRRTRGFVELRTDALTLFPAREYVETDRPVIIDTESGRTTAQGLRADLAAGTFTLGSPARRVRTTITPGTL